MSIQILRWFNNAYFLMTPEKRPSDLDLPRISVVTPSFNQGKYLEETITSVLSQEYPNLEYIIMDGRSTDGSVDIIRKYASQLAYWESKPDKGQYDAVQRGLNLSHGEIMAYLNSDDLYFPWTLKVVAEVFAKFPNVDWLTTSHPSSISHVGRLLFSGPIYNRSRRWFLCTRGRQGYMSQESTFWRRTLWEKAGSKIDTSLRYAGDLELWSRFYQFSSPVLADLPLGIFRYHKEQKTTQIDQYIQEANQILSHFPTPIWFPSFGIRLLNYLFRKAHADGNWLGARCDKVRYNPHTDNWKYKKYLEWRS